MIYKVCARKLWESARQKNVFVGADVDLKDGFIHFSAAHQLRETLRKHFVGRTDLVLLTVDDSQLGAELRWEPSRGGDLFPHLYGPLSPDAVVSVDSICLDSDNADPLSDLPAFKDSAS